MSEMFNRRIVSCTLGQDSPTGLPAREDEKHPNNSGDPAALPRSCAFETALYWTRLVSSLLGLVGRSCVTLKKTPAKSGESLHLRMSQNLVEKS